uniref:NADP-dependent oxidoreductase domain-containing protein n=1 Tax=Castor canadensis TaxID=51338 RepID=A0A8C0WFL3_CASCN
MNSKHQCVQLNDGHFIPVLGFGTLATGEVPKNMSVNAIKLAIDVGFCHFDSAYIYDNEKEVGVAIQSKIADGTVKREDIFVTSKLWPTFSHPDLVKTYENIPKDEHEKIIFDTMDICATWEAMEKCKDAGLAKSIGVSNFNHRQLEMILKKPGLKYKPVCNQVECHLYMNQSKLLDFCKSRDIVLIAYGALGTQRYKLWVNQSSPVLLDDPVLCAMAKKYKQTPALIAFRYLLQRGLVVLAKICFGPLSYHQLALLT